MSDNTIIRKNDLYTNGYYNFSNMYDDSLLTDFAFRIAAETYGESIQFQEDAEPRIRHHHTPTSLIYKSTYGNLKPVTEELASNIYQKLLDRNNDIGDTSASNNYRTNGLKYPSTNQVRKEYNLGENVEPTPYHYKRFIKENFLALDLINFPMPICNKRLYLHNYGITNQIVPIIDTYTKPHIFQNPLLVHIGDYYRFDPIIVGINDGYQILLLPINGSMKEPNNIYAPEDEICIIPQPKSLAFAVGANGNKNRVEISNPSGDNKTNITIKIPTSNIMIGENILYKINDNSEKNMNTYDLYMSSNALKYGHQTMTVMTINNDGNNEIQISDNSPYITIKISKNFFRACNDGYSASSDTGGDHRVFYLIKRPRRVREELHKNIGNSEAPIYSFDYTYNPVSNINFEVFKLENKKIPGTNNTRSWIKRKRICDETLFLDYIDSNDNVKHYRYFPNIIDLSKYAPVGVTNSGIKIEIYEHPSSYTNQKMRNNLTPLINSLTKIDPSTDTVFKGYTEFLINEYYKINKDDNTTNYMHLKDYFPKYYNINVDEYKNSEYFSDTNFRGYMLDKLVQSISTDPYLLKDYYQWLVNKDRRIVSTYGNPAYYKFSTTTNRYNELPHAARYNNDGFTYKPVQEWRNDPHSYIKYYSEGNEVPYMLFLRGRYTNKGYHDYYGSFNYIWYSCKEFNKALTGKNNPNATAYDDCYKKIDIVKPVVLDFFPGCYVSFSDVPMCTIENVNPDESYKLFVDYVDRPIRICDIRVYDKSTKMFKKEVYDFFDIILSVDRYDLDHMTLNPDNVPISSELRSIIYFFTRVDDSEYYLTRNEPINGIEVGPAISLQYPKVKLSLNDLYSDLMQSNVIDVTEKEFFTHKKLHPEELEFKPRLNSLQGSNLIFYLANFKSEFPIDVNNFNHVDDNIYEQTLPGYLQDYDLSRYLVFADGQLNRRFSFEISEFKFGADLKIRYTAEDSSSANDPRELFANKDIILVHMPIDFYLNDVKSIARPNGGYIVRYMKPADLTKSTDSDQLANQSINKLWPDCDSVEIYEDGVVNKNINYSPKQVYPFEDPNNMRFSESGDRLPKFESSVYSINLGYYSKDLITTLISYYTGMGSIADGSVITPKVDYPITNMVEVSPLNPAYNFTGDDESNPVGTNPLDICFLT